MKKHFQKFVSQLNLTKETTTYAFLEKTLITADKNADELASIFGTAYRIARHADESKQVQNACLRLYLLFDAMALLPEPKQTASVQCKTNMLLLKEELVDVLMQSTTVKQGIKDALTLLLMCRDYLLWDKCGYETMVDYSRAIEDFEELYESFALFGDNDEGLSAIID